MQNNSLPHPEQSDGRNSVYRTRTFDAIRDT